MAPEARGRFYAVAFVRLAGQVPNSLGRLPNKPLQLTRRAQAATLGSLPGINLFGVAINGGPGGLAVVLAAGFHPLH